MAIGNLLTPPQPSSDPFELDRLAEELALRESAAPAQSNSNGNYSLPAFIPLSHNNAYLKDPAFKVEEFLLSRSNTSLPDLRLELREYLAQLKDELVKLINDDYEAFISLSTDLKDEGDRLLRLKHPLGDLKLQILESRSELHLIQDTIQAKLSKRAVLREEKALLHLLLKLSESVTRLEALLLIASPEKEPSPQLIDISPVKMPAHLHNHDDSGEERSHRNRAKHLGRAAAEYMQLLYHASKAQAERCQFMEEIQWRMDRIKSTISSDLDHLFAVTLAALTDGKVTDVEKNKLFTDLSECLRTYDLLHLWRDAESILKKEVVRKFVKKTVYPGALVAPHSPILPHTPFTATKTASTPLPPRTPYTPFTSFAPVEQGSSYHLGTASLYNRLLEESDEPLARLYTQSLRFIERDLSRIMEIAEAVSIKASILNRPEKEPNLLTLTPKRTDEGFEILANVIWGELGRAIIDELGAIVFASGQPNEFRKHHQLSRAFIRSLEHLAPSIHSIEVLRTHPVYVTFEHRWQLPVYFQMRWKEIVGNLEDSLAAAKIDPSLTRDRNVFATSQADAVWHAITACWSVEIFIPELCHKFWRLTLQILSRYKTWLDQFLSRSGATIPQESSAENPMVDSTLRQDVAMILDIKAMRSGVLTVWREEISMMLPEMFADSETDGNTSQEALDHILSGLTSLLPQLSAEIITILTKRCCDALLPVRSVPSQFRAMSSKRPPTDPSYFVSSILRPVKLFFGIGVVDGPGFSLRSDYITLYSTEVFENVAQRYIYYLTAMKKTEESLRRLKKGKKTTFSLFGNTNSVKDDDDEERIQTQMILDVESFGKDGESLGINLEVSDSYLILREMVRAPEGVP